MEGMRQWTPRGTPQGAVISPLLANVYLHPVDQALVEAGYEVVRYADDLVILCRSEAEAQRALRKLEALMRERKLRLHPEKTRIVDAQSRETATFSDTTSSGDALAPGKSLRKIKSGTLPTREHRRA